VKTRPLPVKAGVSNEDPYSHAAALVLYPAITAFLGYWLDGRFGTWPLLFLVLLVVGVVGSFASAYYRYEARVADHEVGKPWTRRASR
jgi:F0F1-type ATP synthase assembly protein I